MNKHHRLWMTTILATVITSSSFIGTTHANAGTYKVRAGDTLTKISKNYKVSLSSLRMWNGLHSDRILSGQALKVTAPKKSVASTKNEVINHKKATPVVAKNALFTNKSSLLNCQFPLAIGMYDSFIDTWGGSRKYGGNRTHEGTDIMAPTGTKIYAATDGVIVNYGWNTLGGWRLSIQTEFGYMYYAHLSKYAKGMAKGTTVRQGQLIGYVGDTGYGVEGTSGKFDPHLHFGMYDNNWNAINPYNYLKAWESKFIKFS